MKRILIALSICTIMLTFTSSCKRCIECSYTYTPAGSTTDSTLSVAQKCGNKQDRETYENNVRADAALVGGVVKCDN